MGVRDAILAARAHEEVVSLPQGDVLVRGLTVSGKDALQTRILEGGSWRPAALRSCCFDPETKEPLFTDDDDLDSVAAHIVEPLVDAVTRLTMMSVEEIEELEGNSERTPSDDTASD